jgi:hypothetical protein
VFEKPVGIVAVTAVGRAPAGLYVGDAVGFRSQHTEEGLRTHGAGPNLHVIRLLNYATAIRPILLQLENNVLK